MGINPPTDIVSEVARAADPMKYRAAADRLSQMAGAASPTEFGDVFSATMARSPNALSLDPYTVRTTFRNETTLSGTGKAGAAYQQFEAFILQSFIETMLPKEAESVFGKGTAGGIWKSMMAEQIGTQISKAGGIGIAKKLLAAHPPSAEAGASKHIEATREIPAAIRADLL